MKSAQMLSRARDAFSKGRATLADHRLVFRGVADVEPHAGATVHGALWSISAEDLARLDAYEGYPSLYGRHIVTVSTSYGAASALVYTMTRDRTQTAPSPYYLDVIIAGAREFGVPFSELSDALNRVAAWLKDHRVKVLRIDGKRTHPVYPDFIPEPDADPYWARWEASRWDPDYLSDDLEDLRLEHWSRDNLEDIDG